MPGVEPAVLEAFAESIALGLGSPRTVAGEVAESLVDADLRGHGSHGVGRLPMYAEMVDDGAIDPAAEPTVSGSADGPTRSAPETDTTEPAPDGPTASVDGRHAFGQHVGRIAVREALDRAEIHGVGVVGVRNATHLGRMGEWAERAAAEGCLFLGVANAQGGAITVAPHGSADPRLATNPIAVGAPSFGALPFSIVFDAATSQAANGKLRGRSREDESLPPEWATSSTGEPISDPGRVVGPDADGALLPLGGRATGHKGFGLAVAVELFAGLVGGGRVVGEADPEWFDNAGTFVAIDPLRFVSRETARRRVGVLADHLRSASPVRTTDPSSVEFDESVDATANGDRILLPGEPEYRTARARREVGIQLAEAHLGSIRDLADELDVPVPESLRN